MRHLQQKFSVVLPGDVVVGEDFGVTGNFAVFGNIVIDTVNKRVKPEQATDHFEEPVQQVVEACYVNEFMAQHYIQAVWIPQQPGRQYDDRSAQAVGDRRFLFPGEKVS